MLVILSLLSENLLLIEVDLICIRDEVLGCLLFLERAPKDMVSLESILFLETLDLAENLDILDSSFASTFVRRLFCF